MNEMLKVHVYTSTKPWKNIYHVINYRHVEWGYLYLENLFVETLKKLFFLLYTGHKNCV